ncbi:MAG: hypothetical protein E7232_14760 [Lachnospiraceae bacterium]|nr:hypothetical protein [Lachnospiraceae bacterium]
MIMGSNMVILGTNDLKSWCIKNSKIELIDEWDYGKNGEILPETIAYASNKRIWWKCPKGHSYDARVGNRVFNGNGCPYCSGRKTLEGYNDFKTWCLSNRREDLLDEWDYQKNEISPSQISPQNSIKVWWKCSIGHEWESTIGSRTSGRPSGCPYCSNPPKRILVGFNDFETWCLSNGKDNLLLEWNYERNTDFSPRDITYGCGKRVWWKCSRGHEWCVSPSNRVQGTGCPVCSRTQTSFPEQAIAYYLSKSFSVLQRYREKGFEIDVFLEDNNIGIEYDGLFYHTKANSKRELDKNSFYAERGLKLIRIKESKIKSGVEGNTIYYIPKKSNYLDGSFNEMLCSLAHYLEGITGVHTFKDIDIIRDELAIREQYASIIKNNSVAALFPELVPEWDVEKNNGMTPDNFSANAHTKVWWKCKKGHSWQADISSRNRKLGCPYCAGQRTIIGENDLESWCQNSMPELLDEWDYEKNAIKPSELSKTSNKKVWWRCAEGHEWEAVIANRVHGTRCPYCFTGNDTIRRKKSFADWCKENGHEQLLTEWNYEKNGSITPETVSRASHSIVWWRCSEGHEWEAQVKSRFYNHGCPYCSGTNKKAQVGINDLVTWCEENGKQYILDEWDYEANEGLRPEMFTFGSHKRINWKCAKGHTWTAVIKERTKFKGNMCPDCKKE